MDKDKSLKLPESMVKKLGVKPGHVFRWILWTSDEGKIAPVLYVIPD